MSEDEENERLYEEILELDQKNMGHAMDRLIDSVSGFKANDITELTTEAYAQMLEDLDFAKFIVSGIMYKHNLPYCGHDHDEEEDD